MNKLFTEEKTLRAVIVISIALGVMFGTLFLWHGLGINYVIFAIFAIAALWWLLKFRKDFSPAVFLPLALCVTVLSCNYLISTNNFFYALNFILIPLLMLSTVMLSQKNKVKNVFSFFSAVFVPFVYLNRLFLKIGEVCFPKSSDKKKIVLSVFLGVALALIALTVILPIMISADAAFEELFSKFFVWREMPDKLLKILLCAFVAAYVFGFAYFNQNGKTIKNYPIYCESDAEKELYRAHVNFERPSAELSEGVYSQPVKETAHKAEKQTVLISFLLCVLLVYAVFSAVQILYLFMRVSTSLPKDFSFAEYARKGIFQLWVLTVIDLVITLGGMTKAEKINGKLKKSFKAIFTVYTAVNLCMSAAGFYKMNMYIGEYGFTRFRTLVMIYLVVQMLLLTLLFFKIYMPSLKYAFICFMSITLLYTALNCINLDANVAKLNIRRYEQTGKIDLIYLTEDLSADAFETLYGFMKEEYGFELNKASNYDMSAENEYYADDKEYAFYKMQQTYSSCRESVENGSWQEYNIVKRQVLKLK